MCVVINELGRQIHQNAVERGFWDNPRNTGEMLMLIVSEISEAMEADRKDDDYNPETRLRLRQEQPKTRWAFDLIDKDPEAWNNWFISEVKNTFPDELADAMIRIMDLAHHRGIDLEWHIWAKMRYNSTRPHKHGKKY